MSCVITFLLDAEGRVKGRANPYLHGILGRERPLDVDFIWGMPSIAPILSICDKRYLHLVVSPAYQDLGRIYQ